MSKNFFVQIFLVVIFICGNFGYVLNAAERERGEVKQEEVRDFLGQFRLYPVQRWQRESRAPFFDVLEKVQKNLSEESKRTFTISQLAGLSVWSLRFQFDPEWNLSASDPFCGFNSGEFLLINSGFNYKISYNKRLHFLSDTSDKEFFSVDEFHELLENSQEEDYLIMGNIMPHPFYGTLAGKEKAKKELPGPPHGKLPQHHLPWVVIELNGLIEQDIRSLYDRSLITARTLYDTKRVGPNFCGTEAFKEWRDALSRLDKANMENEEWARACFCNTWLYESLMIGRRLAADYVLENIDQFSFDWHLLEEIAGLYKKEKELLERNQRYCVLPLRESIEKEKWTEEMRKAQLKVLEELNELEELVYLKLKEL